MFPLRIFLLIFLISTFTDCLRTKDKIYVPLKTITGGCFRNLNATHQVGCSSASGGNVGVLHYLDQKSDFDWVLQDGSHAPYVVLIRPKDFTMYNVKRLAASKRVNGVLVIHLKNYTWPNSFSADKKCPNDAYGMYHNSSQYGNCRQVEWNGGGDGMFFHDFGLSMFVVTNETDLNRLLVECYERFNKPVDGKARSYPLCAVQLKEVMFAAKDSVTCVRRSHQITNVLHSPKIFCDSLGDKNIIATLKNENTNDESDRAVNSVIVVSTQMDSFSMFDGEFLSSDNTITGIVALLAIAEALAKHRSDFEAELSVKDVLFAFFQGEAWDYIGSSRTLYEMDKDRFPRKLEKSVTLPKLIKLGHISHLIELRQLGKRDQGKLWMHTDPISKKSKWISDQVEKMTSLFETFGKAAKVDIGLADTKRALPPASSQRFLLKRTIPTVVLTDHRDAYTNMYYNSRFDLPKFIKADSDSYDNVTQQAEDLTKVATVVAKLIYQLAMGKKPSDSLAADKMTVTHLLYCFQHPPQCELFNRSIDEVDEKVLKERASPFPFYVSVAKNTNHITSLTLRLLAQFIGKKVADTKKADCKAKEKDESLTYIWMQGALNGTEREGWCIKSTARLTAAESPAFLDEMSDYDWKSGVYSTWTESSWEVFEVKMFLIPSSQFQTTVLSVGVIVMLISFLIIFFINKNSGIIFQANGSPRYYTY